MSRRRFIQYGLASLAMAPFATWAQSEKALSSQSSSVDTTNLQTGVDIAKRLTVPVYLNGQGPFHFVVDTGAEQTVISDEIATALGLARGAQIRIHGIAKSMVSETVLVTKLTLGTITKARLRLPTLPRALLRCDGFLGMDVLDGNRVIFNFDKQTLTVTHPRSNLATTPLRSDETVIGVHGKRGRLRSSDCRIDGVRAEAFIDSGAEISAGNPSLFNALVQKNRARNTGSTKVYGVTGGELEGHITEISKVKLQDLTFTKCALVIADLEVFSVWKLRDTPALLIGMNYLRQFSQVSIDYGRGEFRFELANRRPTTECACTMPNV